MSCSNQNAMFNISSSINPVNEERLVAENLGLVRRIARPYFLAGGDGEDLIQEGMLGLIAAIRSYDDTRGAPFHSYAEICVRNRIISAVRRAAKTPNVLPLESQATDLNDLSPVSDPLEIIIARERALELTDLLRSGLSSFESNVLDMYLDGLSYAEISARTGRDIKSTDNAVQRIRRKLAKLKRET